jgi:probable addiction module antidote protein
MKVSKLKKFDAAEHLRTPQARAEYLNLVLTDGDPAEIRDALNLVARAQGMSEIAKAAGVTREGLLQKHSARMATRSLQPSCGSSGPWEFGSSQNRLARSRRRKPWPDAFCDPGNSRGSGRATPKINHAKIAFGSHLIIIKQMQMALAVNAGRNPHFFAGTAAAD